MLTEDQILNTLDNSGSGDIMCFIQLGHPYSYLIDCRLNVLRGDKERWAIAGEVLGYNPRGGAIRLEVFYYGNCLFNLYHQPMPDAGYNILTPIDWDNFNATVTEEESISPDAQFWLVRGTEVPLSHDKQEYLQAGIELNEYELNAIGIEKAGRLAVTKYRHLFRTTDEELYRSIPADLKKILVADEWYHKDYVQLPVFEVDESAMPLMGKEAYEAAKKAVNGYREINEREWQENRPSSYESWQQIAKVIVTGDASHYKPTLEPNTHWKYWPESGSL